MISVIIPAYQSEGEIGGLLEGIARSAVKDREVIVIDDGSTDGTAAAARSYSGVTVITLDKNSGPSRARNLGASQARGDVIVFIDSDVLLPEDSDILGKIESVFSSNPEVDCLSTLSAIEPTVPSAVAYNNSVYHNYYMDRIFRERPLLKGKVMFFTTRLGAIRTERFRQAGGFYESLTTVMNEDGEFGARCYHLGYVSYFSRDLVHRHRFPTTFTRYIKSYVLTAMVQAMIDRKMDTGADESVSAAEKFRRLYAGSWVLLPVLLALLPAERALPAAGGWAFFFVVSLAGLNGMIWRHVPARFRLQWYLIYAAITPFILAGYAYGLLLHAGGRSLLQGRPSALEFFSAKEKVS